jgi:flagellar hook-associated protein 1 FlgK
MANFSIGISGLNAAQTAIEIIGNNIANAATEGYHRQKVELTPAYSSSSGSLFIGGGVNVGNMTRMIDNLLEQELLQQRSSMEQISQEYATLRSIENAFGELASENSGLNVIIDNFFSSLDDLSANAGDVVYQTQAVEAANSMASQFRLLGNYLTTLKEQIDLEADNAVEQINTLASQIARYNEQIGKQEIKGSKANNLSDQRDQCITELSKLIGVEIQYRDYGVVDVRISGISVVVGTFAAEVETGYDDAGKLGISLADAYTYESDIVGGRLGGLLSLKNELIADIQSDLDSLANAIITQINQYHVQGVGSAGGADGGSFTSLTGWAMANDDLSDFVPPITSGDIYIRVTDTSSSTTTRHKIEIPGDCSSVTEIATYITNNITGLSASVDASLKLSITADTDYEFDFLPGVLPTPTDVSGLTVPAPAIAVSGIYTGTTNQTYTCTVIDGGTISNTEGLQIQVSHGGTTTTVNVGSGYAAGDTLDIGEGVYISLGAGTLVAGETFTIEALANSDTSGFLAEAGINTLFSGSTASNMSVCADILANPGRIATSRGMDMTDNTNMKLMATVADESLSSLNNMNPGSFYQLMATDIGQKLSIRQMRQENAEVMLNNLLNQQGEISGVNINDEAAQLLIFEQMFQAMAKYITTVQTSMATIMELL